MNDELRPAEHIVMETAEEPAEQPVISEMQTQRAFETFRSEQNLVMGTLAGLVASVAGASIWAGVTVMTEYQIGWMAIGIGLMIGFAVRFTGKGISPTYGIVGGALALLGCVLGNVLTITYYVAVNQEMAYMDILTQLNYPIIAEMLTATFEFIDVLFYGLAMYFGYKYAFRQISEEDLNRALGKAM